MQAVCCIIANFRRMRKHDADPLLFTALLFDSPCIIEVK